MQPQRSAAGQSASTRQQAPAIVLPATHVSSAVSRPQVVCHASAAADHKLPPPDMELPAHKVKIGINGASPGNVVSCYRNCTIALPSVLHLVLFANFAACNMELPAHKVKVGIHGASAGTWTFWRTLALCAAPCSICTRCVAACDIKLPAHKVKIGINGASPGNSCPAIKFAPLRCLLCCKSCLRHGAACAQGQDRHQWCAGLHTIHSIA